MGPGVSYECEEQNGSHICEDHFYPEIIHPDTLEQLADKQIFIEYMYAFAQGDKAHVVIRPNDLAHCVQVLEECQCDVIRTGDF